MAIEWHYGILLVTLENSGQTTALVQAEVATSGTTDSFLKGSHLTRTRHAHQFSKVHKWFQ